MNWVSIKSSIVSALGWGASTAAGAAASAPLMGIPAAITAGAQAATAVTNGIREANRAATLRAIAAELHANADAIDAAIAKANQRKKTAHITINPAVLLAAALALASFGCASAPPREASGDVATFIARPDFPAAAKAAPEWTRAVLKALNSKDAALQAERARAGQLP